jgi:AmmeMemoRadiSam system protein B
MRAGFIRWLLVCILISVGVPGAAQEIDPEVRALLQSVGLKPQGSRRGQMDTVGFAVSAAEMDAVLAQCDSLAAASRSAAEELANLTEDAGIIAAVCPHDDYYYAGRLYSLLLPRVRARTVLIFGVFHKARVFGCRDKLVFDAFATWHGPYGPVKVSPLRETLIARLPEDSYVVSNDMQMVEHSVEAIVPFLQAYNRDVEIVSILVPHMDWNTLDRLASELTGALAAALAENAWSLGSDICLISSSDAVHYGDAGWGGRTYADFGSDVEGYRLAVERDIALAEKHLAGPIDRRDLREFLYACVDAENVMNYRITWCGRFSVPFGLDVASRLVERFESRSLRGVLLDYGTSVSEASLDLEGVGGLGTTAPNNLHHWVGYAAIAYR